MLDPMYLLIIGGVFVILELMLTNFILIFFGFGFIIVGLLSFAISLTWEWQLLIAFVLSLVLMFALKSHFIRLFHKNSEEIKDNFLDETGIGEVKNEMIYYKGTFWRSEDIKDLKDGDKVEVVGIKNNRIVIKK